MSGEPPVADGKRPEGPVADGKRPEAPLEALVRTYGAKEASEILGRNPGWKTTWRGLLARENQLAPQGDWYLWVYMAGRGAGKTRSGAEWVRERIDGGSRTVHLVGATAADVRDTMLCGHATGVLGEKVGLLDIWPERQRPVYEPSKRLIQFHTGAIGLTFSAEEPERLRGPQCETLWMDELAAWPNGEALEQGLFGLRLGEDPRGCITTTPRPVAWLKSLLGEDDIAVTRGSSKENRMNLAPKWFQKITSRFQGTRMGRQELDGEMLEDTEGALWSHEQIERFKVKTPPGMVRVVVGVDPSAGHGPQNDEQGIVAVGLGEDGLIYVLADWTCKLTPEGWGGRAVDLGVRVGAACIVVEKNTGGEMAAATIQGAARGRGEIVRTKAVSARVGKVSRAEPISALYEQGRVRHLPGLEKLEDEMCRMTPMGYEGGGSPNRVDAMVHAATEVAAPGFETGEIVPSLVEWAEVVPHV